jgi:hypothetical protein
MSRRISSQQQKENLDPGGDDLLALKRNHQNASTAIKAHFHPQIEHHLSWRNTDHCFNAFENTYGRYVCRHVWVMTDLEALPALKKWPGLQAVMAVLSQISHSTQFRGKASTPSRILLK